MRRALRSAESLRITVLLYADHEAARTAMRSECGTQACYRTLSNIGQSSMQQLPQIAGIIGADGVTDGQVQFGVWIAVSCNVTSELG